VDKIYYYLEHVEERLSIAKAGHDRFWKEYTNKQYWAEILRRINRG
jgi:spore maturation protein CgeB